MDFLTEIIGTDTKAILKKFKKKEIIQKEGVVSKNAFYVKKGLIRSYSVDEKGKEHIFMFGAEDWIIADLESNVFNKPSELCIETIEDSEIVIFTIDDFNYSESSKEKLQKNSKLLARRIGSLQRRVIQLMSSSAKERYQMFLETYPLLPNRVPQKMIASYLGITPEALSKIRGES
ncbi:MAG: Crp/Fnr family transcriptional regulator [Flavobacteriales bacterium]|nr:Crp/Fnr family transcriptional regulator [Flavobacteriales bacterium]